MTMIERVARAMATARWKINGSEKFDPNYAYDLTNNNGRFEFDEMARAAIQAMREPTEEMLDRAPIWRDDAARYHRAMIDAALSETSEDKS